MSKYHPGHAVRDHSANFEERRAMGLMTAMILMLAVLGLGHSAGPRW
ncbi:MAG TPA: hypothetical protein VHB77_10970 [Planctomycetaceae bacterium]|nr:hypothetical protein [Planctomycetaceae bacterium]